MQVSTDGTTWSKPVAEGKGEGARTTITFAPARAKFVRITQTESAADAPAWSIRNLRIYEALFFFLSLWVEGGRVRPLGRRIRRKSMTCSAIRWCAAAP